MTDSTRPRFTHYGDQSRCNRCEAWMQKGEHRDHDCPQKVEEPMTIADIRRALEAGEPHVDDDDVTRDLVHALHTALAMLAKEAVAPASSTDAGKAALAEISAHFAAPQKFRSVVIARAEFSDIAAHVSALEARLAEYGTEDPNRYHSRLASEMEARALAAEGERDRMRGLVETAYNEGTLNARYCPVPKWEESDSHMWMNDPQIHSEDVSLSEARAALTPPTEGETP